MPLHLPLTLGQVGEGDGCSLTGNFKPRSSLLRDLSGSQAANVFL